MDLDAKNRQIAVFRLALRLSDELLNMRWPGTLDVFWESVIKTPLLTDWIGQFYEDFREIREIGPAEDSRAYVKAGLTLQREISLRLEAWEQFALDPFGVDSSLLEFPLLEDGRMKTRRRLNARNS